MPKYISLKDAHHILENCAAVIWGDNFLCYPGLYELSEAGDSQFMELSITDGDGNVFEASFFESDNERVRVKGSSMFLTDDEGEEVEITILWADENSFEKCENIGAHEVF